MVGGFPDGFCVEFDRQTYRPVACVITSPGAARSLRSSSGRRNARPAAQALSLRRT